MIVEKKRVFLSIPLEDKSFALSLEKKIKDFKKRIRKISSLCRWIDKENFHLTIIFLGSLSLEEIELIKVEAKEVASFFSPFSLFFEEICLAPKRNFAKMVWLKGKKSPSLEDLERKLRERIVKKGIYLLKRRPFLIPHITLARLRNILTNAPEISEKFEKELLVKKISLWESKLSPQGARYFPLKDFLLEKPM